MDTALIGTPSKSSTSDKAKQTEQAEASLSRKVGDNTEAVNPPVADSEKTSEPIDEEKSTSTKAAVPPTLAGVRLGGISVLMVAVSAAASAEGITAFVRTLSSESLGWLEALEAGMAATLVMLIFGVPCALVLGLIANWASGRRAVAGVTHALGGTDERVGAIPILSGGLGLLGVLALGTFAGYRFIAMLSPPFAAAATVMVTLVATAAGFGLAARLGALLQKVTSRYWRWNTPGLTLAILFWALVLGVGLAGRVPTMWLPPLLTGTAIVGLVQLQPLVRRIAVLSASKRISASLITGVFVLSLTSLVWMQYLSQGAKDTLLYRTEYVPRLLRWVQTLADRDRDGYSAIALGGDCNDGDHEMNPGAIDVPGNNKDENCSGADAKPYVPVKQPRMPNETLPGKKGLSVILLLIDALRYDHLSFNGYERPTTPRLGEFKKSATWFKRTYTTSPSTRWALSSLFTGIYPNQLDLPFYKGASHLSKDVTTIAERLDSVGYDRVGYTITYAIHRFSGYDQGFRYWDTPWKTRRWEWEWGRAAPRTTDAVIKYLRKVPQDGQRPYFVFAHYRCPHDPYVKHPEIADFGDRDIDKYDSAVAFCDHHVGRVLDEVDARRDKDKTAVIVMSDHGELFGDHTAKYHGETLYEADARALLLVRIPSAPVRTVEVPVSLLDLSRTILHIAKAPGASQLEGWNLLPLMFNATQQEQVWRQRPIFLHTLVNRSGISFNKRGVVLDQYKYIYDITGRKSEFFDVVADPLERSPLKEPRQVRDNLANLLESWLAQAGTSTSSPPQKKRAAKKKR